MKNAASFPGPCRFFPRESNATCTNQWFDWLNAEKLNNRVARAARFLVQLMA